MLAALKSQSVTLFCLFGANVFKGDALLHQALSQVAGSR
jgi:hypothetical protein